MGDCRRSGHHKLRHPRRTSFPSPLLFPRRVLKRDKRKVMFLVLEANPYIPVNPCIGNKIYKLLPVNYSTIKTPVFLEERYLKKKV
jgi:hypothetical protein